MRVTSLSTFVLLLSPALPATAQAPKPGKRAEAVTLTSEEEARRPSPKPFR